MPSDYQSPSFLGRTVPVELIARLSDCHLDGQSLVMACETERYSPQMFNYYGTDVETVYQAVEPGRPWTVRLDFWSDEVFRLRSAPSDTVPDNATPMLVGEPQALDRFEMIPDATAIRVETGALTIIIRRSPWELRVHDRSGALLFHTTPLDIEPLRFPLGKAEPVEERWTFYLRFAYPLGVTVEERSPQAFSSFGLAHDEHIYGFGEGFGPFDKRGTLQDLWVRECLSNSSPGAYKQTPFYLSTHGYGLFVNTANHIRFHVGELEHTQLSTIVDDTCFLDWFFLYGPDLRDILPRYTQLTGKPHVPPRWSFGLWMSRISYNSQSQVEEVAEELRQRRIPCDVIHIDTDWFERDWECDLRFGREKFPNPEMMIAKLREQGFRISLWQWPNLVIGTELFAEARARGYLARWINGKAYIYSGDEETAAFLDYSNPDAVAWYQEKITALLRMGVSVIKVDFGEGAEPDAVYQNTPAEVMHNLYPLLYAKAIFEATEKYWGTDEAVIWCRAGWAGSQRYPVHWSGDGVGRFEDLACVLRSVLSFGLSGFPFYSHDIGGFVGNPSAELYVRWAQLGLLSSHARIHGYPPREPWAYGERAEALFREMDELRYRLMPYIFSEALACGESSLPMLRPLVLDYQDDPTTYTLADQYLFGRSLLVAPILDSTNRRQVYLPQGQWVDYWTKQVLAGGRWIAVEASLGQVPLYVPAGAIVPYGPLMQHTQEAPCDPLTIEVYHPGKAGSYCLRHDRTHQSTISYHSGAGGLELAIDPLPGNLDLVIYGFPFAAAEVDGATCKSHAEPDGGQRIARLAPGEHRVLLRTA